MVKQSVSPSFMDQPRSVSSSRDEANNPYSEADKNSQSYPILLF